MSSPRRDRNRGSLVQLWAILFVTLVVMALGAAVVLSPERMGVPRPASTSVATPVASPGS